MKELFKMKGSKIESLGFRVNLDPDDTKPKVVVTEEEGKTIFNWHGGTLGELWKEQLKHLKKK